MNAWWNTSSTADGWEEGSWKASGWEGEDWKQGHWVALSAGHALGSSRGAYFKKVERKQEAAARSRGVKRTVAAMDDNELSALLSAGQGALRAPASWLSPASIGKVDPPL